MDETHIKSRNWTRRLKSFFLIFNRRAEFWVLEIFSEKILFLQKFKHGITSNEDGVRHNKIYSNWWKIFIKFTQKLLSNCHLIKFWRIWKEENYHLTFIKLNRSVQKWLNSESKRWKEQTKTLVEGMSWTFFWSIRREEKETLWR